jgi:hypothetical protein
MCLRVRLDAVEKRKSLVPAWNQTDSLVAHPVAYLLYQYMDYRNV